MRSTNEGNETMQNFLFVDLAGLTPGKPFAGFAAGSFVDMNGRAVEFKAATLKTFIANTLKAVEAAKKKGMPGLPIDARAHDKGDAAGWIVGASEGEVEDSEGKAVPVIMLAAEWTKLGLELLKEKIVANFSPTVDLKSKVIRGGSLTNWPASVDASGAPLFPAVELAEGMYRLELQEKSLDAQIEAVRRAWARLYRMDDGYMTSDGVWVIEVFDDYLIAGGSDKQYRVAYTVTEDAIEFTPRDEWVEVEQAWVEAQIGRELTDSELGPSPARATAKPSAGAATAAGDETRGNEQSVDHSDEVMDMTREELAALVAEQVKAALAAELQGGSQPAGDDKPAFDVLSFLEMGEAGDEVVSAFKTRMLEEYEGMKKRATVEVAQTIARIRRDADIAEFAQGVTGGTTEAPYGLPVGIDDLKEFLGRLQPTDLEFAKKLLGDIQTHGRQKFAELGHGKMNPGGAELPAAYAGMLDRGELTVADLAAPELALGDLGRYDLSRWNGGK